MKFKKKRIFFWTSNNNYQTLQEMGSVTIKAQSNRPKRIV